MEQPPPGPDPELQAPPRLNTGKLWFSLLLPMGLTALFMGGMLLVGPGSGEETVANIGMLVVLIASIACWLLFANCIGRRYIGSTRVILVLMYPFIQSVLVFVVFFAGCLLLIGRSGFH